jgi:GNAT superfamily N-acetyltransferase
MMSSNIERQSEGEDWQLSVLIRESTADERATLSDLCLRSKAVWGYSEPFMEACRRELTLTPQDFFETLVGLAEDRGKIVGVVQIAIVQDIAELLKLFVEPTALQRGVGRQLLTWACAHAKALGAVTLHIDSDPGAVSFYRRMGAVDAGCSPSESIPGRMLPHLVLEL